MTAFKPHPYQQRGVRWILDHPSCGLFLPMGAGKTATTLTAVEYLLRTSFESWKVLVIGPKRVIETTWPGEIQKWDNLAGLRISVIAGTPKKREAAVHAEADIYLISKENVVWLVDLIGKDWPWDTVVIDELSTFKNPKSKRFRALRKMLPMISRLIGLTGTPSPKGIPDLWSQIYLMDRGERLGRTLGAFRTAYLKPGMTSGHVVYNWSVQPGASEVIQKRISDICMSIDQAEYATLPDCQMIDIPVDLGSDLKKYQAFKKELVLDVGSETIAADSAGVMCGKLLQYTSGAIYDEDHNVHVLHKHKLESLLELMESANGQPVMIFYWYQHEKARIAEALKGYKGMDVKDKGAIQKWNRGDLGYLLLQPSSAGHGLNLQKGGHIAIWYSLPNWNLELYQQANARIYRQGQKEKVLIYHLMAKGTIDQDMLKALKSKEITQRDLLDALRI
ncbi:DEAD/DEAH box helicase [Allobaculum fili]|uniref:DEAD/DEAH box helicase n=2 Tax=Allobaculum TaxID=174708 RepID=UPI001E46DA18|nr:DEAD/DEAH box helicase [Allobaculum fili]